MKKIRFNESDIERLVNKIIKEEEIDEVGIKTFKRGNLKPAIATFKGVKKLVIVDEDNNVEAIGPTVSYLQGKGYGEKEICKIADKLIEELFDLEEGTINELDRSDFDNIQPINFCRRDESVKILGGLISESELEKMVSDIIGENFGIEDLPHEEQYGDYNYYVDMIDMLQEPDGHERFLAITGHRSVDDALDQIYQEIQHSPNISSEQQEELLRTIDGL